MPQLVFTPFVTSFFILALFCFWFGFAILIASMEELKLGTVLADLNTAIKDQTGANCTDVLAEPCLEVIHPGWINGTLNTDVVNVTCSPATTAHENATTGRFAAADSTAGQ